MKLPKPKYAVTVIDRLHFVLQLAGGCILGFVCYVLTYGVVQVFENRRFMNDADAKEYVAGVGVQILIVILNLLFVHIAPSFFGRFSSAIKQATNMKIPMTTICGSRRG